MFIGRSDEARALYLKYKGQLVREENAPWEQTVSNDFDKFEQAGLRSAQMAQIRADLGIAAQTIPQQNDAARSVPAALPGTSLAAAQPIPPGKTAPAPSSDIVVIKNYDIQLADEERDCLLIENKKCKSTEKPGYEYCQRECSEDAQCVSFTYNVWNKRCFTKRSAGTFLRYDPRSISGIKAGTPFPASSKGTDIVTWTRKDRVFVGKDGTTVDQGTGGIEAMRVEDCKAWCEQQPLSECLAYNYNKISKQCRKLREACDHFPDTNFDIGYRLHPPPG